MNYWYIYCELLDLCATNCQPDTFEIEKKNLQGRIKKREIIVYCKKKNLYSLYIFWSQFSVIYGVILKLTFKSSYKYTLPS